MCREPLLASEITLCTSCIAALPYTRYWLQPSNPVAEKFWGQVPLQGACALVHFRKGTQVRKLLHLLKYKGKVDIGYKLGYLLGVRLKESPIFADIDVVIPVPLHPKRHKERGYNQSDFIAEGIADALGIKAECGVVIRNVYTSTQTRKNRIERFGNVRSIFTVAAPQLLSGKHVLVVDDIITTGATIESCAAEVLQQAGCRVSIAAIGTV